MRWVELAAHCSPPFGEVTVIEEEFAVPEVIVNVLSLESQTEVPD